MTQDLIGKTVAHYQILSLLGEGGMGIVYRAEDTKLQREVALKFLSGHLLSDDEDRVRFLNEARAAASLSHPNICTVHEIDEVDGHTYISMAYLEGSSLKDLLVDGPLDRNAALSYALQIAEGLGEAHGKNVVHRDIKPGNIMITPANKAIITDFGLAKTSGSPELTQLGAAVGTAAYMSPEQARGEAVDSRSDVWSLGALLYEMLTGQKAFQGDHEPGVMYAICHMEPRGLQGDASAFDAGVTGILRRCLQKDPLLRYQSVDKLRADLATVGGGAKLPADARRRPWKRWMPAAFFTLILAWVALDGPGSSWLRGGGEGIPDRKYLAILPFANIGGDPENQALGDGLHEYLSSKLTQLEGLRDAFWVVPAADIRKSEITSPMEARQVFGVNLAVVGSVARDNGDITLTLNLTDPDSHRTLNSAVLEDSVSKASVLQADVLGALIEMLRVELSPEELLALEAGLTQVSLAQEYYLKGLGFMQDLDYLQRRAKLDAVDTAIEFFVQAIEKDPNYALAELGLGEAYWQRYLWSRQDEWIPKAVTHCERSLVLDDELQDARISLAVIFREIEECDHALTLLDQALAEDPSNIRALRELGDSYAKRGDAEKADSILKQAIAIRPDDWVGHQKLGLFYVDQFRFEEAIAEFQQVQELTPQNYFRGYTDLAGVYLYLRRGEEAAELLNRSIEIKPSYDALSNLGTYHYMNEDYEKAIQYYNGALALHSHDYRLWGNLAAAQFRIEETSEQGVISIRRAVELCEDQRTVTPREPALLSRLASYYHILDQDENALELLEELARLDSSNAEVMFQIGHTYEKMGYRDDALSWLKKCVEAGYPRSKIENESLLGELRDDERWVQYLNSLRGEGE
ncbi:protein kinase [bacterium]|nr:protein kinase [bacterium]